jgi:Spy/CpxP family protein refolding chaperone
VKAKVYLLLIAVFLLGAVAGGGGVYAYIHRRHADAMHRRFSSEGRMGALAKELDLTPEQQTRVKEILERHRGEERKKMHEEIRAVLTPTQQERFDKLAEKRKHHR